ncbi:FMRFamide receptor-like [Leptidea sinapis]|uniref:FMRFamide receptor-like n=1 Tax=Leptidea sinapis TaxID=189913 RepID=UPI0021321695|nr:FMRFamide receptor-like [Leptidea sinapis]XP_050663677.1 FMRFamide receptor-like [Leptidea sinapis]XP_050663678.1 FMRFamide receptor-like [Leptidea sinapis]XP_050663679.1 FMRFamide receptor-like [Leptidea sinapis]
MNGSAALECYTELGVSPGDKAFRFVVHGVLLNGIGAAGLLGNALAVLVLSRPQMRSSINCLLVGLAACDTLLILTSLLLFGLTAVYPYTGHLRYYYYHICPHITPYVYPLANAAQTMSVYLTLIVTVERWVAVCHPFRAKSLCTSSRARWYVLGTALFALVYNAPKLFEAEVVAEGAPGGEVVYCVQADMSFRTDTYVAIYIHWMYLLVMYIVPFSALAALNACIVRQVRRAQAERARLSRVQRRELGLATMLLVVVLVFFICNLLPLVTNAFEVFLGDEFDHLDPLVKTSNLMVTINSSVNFLIYVIFGEKFKRVFLKMFCAGRVRRGWTRGSPDQTRDDSFASCGERMSLRLVRDGTLRRSDARPNRTRPRVPPAPAPTVYYPAPPTPSTDVSVTSLAPDVAHHVANGNSRIHF